MNTPLPDNNADTYSPIIVAHTRNIVNAYAQAGALDLDGIHKMAYVATYEHMRSGGINR